MPSFKNKKKVKTLPFWKPSVLIALWVLLKNSLRRAYGVLAFCARVQSAKISTAFLGGRSSVWGSVCPLLYRVPHPHSQSTRGGGPTRASPVPPPQTLRAVPAISVSRAKNSLPIVPRQFRKQAEYCFESTVSEKRTH